VHFYYVHVFQVKVDAEKKLGKKFPMYKAIDYETQTVGGLNFKIKVSLPHALNLTNYFINFVMIFVFVCL